MEKGTYSQDYVNRQQRGDFIASDIWSILGSIKYLNFALWLVSLLTSFFAFYVFIFTRSKIGQRMFTIRTVIIAGGSMYLVKAILNRFTLIAPSNWLDNYVKAFIVICILQKLNELWLRWWKREQWYSYSMGISHISRLIPKIPEFIVDLIIEPVVILFIGLYISQYDSIGVIIQIGALALFALQYIGYQNSRHQVLNQIDGQIITGVIQDAISNESRTRTKGFSFLGAVQTKEERDSLKNVVSAAYSDELIERIIDLRELDKLEE